MTTIRKLAAVALALVALAVISLVNSRQEVA